MVFFVLLKGEPPERTTGMCSVILEATRQWSSPPPIYYFSGGLLVVYTEDYTLTGLYNYLSNLFQGYPELTPAPQYESFLVIEAPYDVNNSKGFLSEDYQSWLSSFQFQQ